MPFVKPVRKRRRSTSQATSASGESVTAIAATKPGIAAAADAAGAGDRPAWYRSTWALAVISSVLMWMAFPPLGLWPLAWVAPIGFLVLIRRSVLPGKRPYWGIWMAGLVYWLVLFQFVRLPHWTAYFGWVALALYLSIYLPLFIGISRVAVHRLRMPLIVAAPIVWTGLEGARSYLFTGLSVALLGHTQVAWPAVIQVADIVGAYGVGFVIMLSAACLTRMLPMNGKRWTMWPAAAMAAAIGAVLLYGHFRLQQSPGADDQRMARVALIQGSFDTLFSYDPERDENNFRDYLEQTMLIRRQHPELDLVIWPESMFSGTLPEFRAADVLAPPPPDSGLSAQQYRQRIDSLVTAFQNKTYDVAQRVNTLSGDEESRRLNIHLLVGTESLQYGSGPVRRYNSAVLIDPDGQVVNRYDKMHLVMFGEYVPLGNLFPWLYSLTPMSQGLTPGAAPQVFQVAGMRFAPSICFESTVPHLIRRQLADLNRQGAPADVLVNVTNDGWFWGSSALDMHLACSVLRAVENRRPMLIAANTGISAWIDGNGRVIKQGPRRAPACLYAEVRVDSRSGAYQHLGDWPAIACLGFCLFAGAVGLRRHHLRS
jgi:apolipoprotein N-acyltransferase